MSVVVVVCHHQLLPHILGICLGFHKHGEWSRETIENSFLHYTIMAYGSTPYVGMAPKKNGGHIKSAQITRSKCLR